MNRYIKAMEIGLANEKSGITYNDLINELEKSIGHKMTLYAESTFYYWFLDNFSATNVEFKNTSGWKVSFEYYYYHKNKIEKTKSNLTASGESLYNNLNRYKWFLNGQASKQYIDYLELKESREASNRAQASAEEANNNAIESINLARKSLRWAVLAIIFSGIFGLGGIISSIWSAKTSPKPPYEVKVIEDATKSEKFEQTIDSLKNELFKADMLIDIYESDSTITG